MPFHMSSLRKRECSRSLSESCGGGLREDTNIPGGQDFTTIEGNIPPTLSSPPLRIRQWLEGRQCLAVREECTSGWTRRRQNIAKGLSALSLFSCPVSWPVCAFDLSRRS